MLQTVKSGNFRRKLNPFCSLGIDSSPAQTQLGTIPRPGPVVLFQAMTKFCPKGPFFKTASKLHRGNFHFHSGFSKL
jgi:hypothetical protein